MIDREYILPAGVAGQAIRLTLPPAKLSDLADQCESLAADRQRWGLARVLQVMGIESPGGAGGEQGASRQGMWISLLADSGAYESAAFALLPVDCQYCASRDDAGLHSATVVLAGGHSASSQGAGSVSMAVCAALLRALAHQRSATPHLA
ncbi:hypothetical protein [Novosphingobium olei]|uniref:hypothetical protein n=1 Tax=Novosphingobium olei TaxID=2728851 RepID=UPI003087C637|nr:hypothetical protein NSDW_02200 [Novosphingobium olei]